MLLLGTADSQIPVNELLILELWLVRTHTQTLLLLLVVVLVLLVLCLFLGKHPKIDSKVLHVYRTATYLSQRL